MEVVIMPNIRVNQNFHCGNCKRKMETGEDYYIVDRIGYCGICADEAENEKN